MTEEMAPEAADSDIAVIGTACRFPGASSPDELWRNVAGGVESIRRLSDAELRAEGVDAASLADPRYVKACADLRGMELFDAGFFGLSAREAAVMDPQHRHFLECAWEALEDAGHPPARFSGSIGVFAGCGMNAYFMFHLLTNPDLVKSVGLFLLRHTGNDKDFLATRVSYCFNLRGPSIGIQTACSTSLVAIHVACQHLLSGECDMAIAGGATIELPHRRGYTYEEGEILSPDGHCRAFDASSKGTVFGSGAGVVVLRRLRDALEDGDNVLAVVKGSAVNNDGSSKVGYLAPSVDGQAKAVLEALTVAGVSADTVSYVEAHGTGTPVGDPIEIAAMTQAFRKHTKRNGYCAIGSVKTNIGHLDTAAGAASFIKAVEALRHGKLPPSLHFASPNPACAFEETPFTVNATLREWQSASSPRRACVNSLGVGGTNAHVVLEEAPALEPTRDEKTWKLLVLSARSEAALEAATDRLAKHLDEAPPASLADAAYTLQVGRKAFSHGRVLACRGAADAAAALRGRDRKRVFSQERLEGEPAVVYLFPGGGAQFPNMGLDVYREERVYHTAIDELLDMAKARHGIDLRPHLFPSAGELEQAARTLERPLLSTLSLFVTELALARLWTSWGIRPAAMTGHSLGEYAAACVAGVLTADDALALVVARGEIFERLPEGAMLSVPLPEADLRGILTQGLSIAAVNAPALCVASGSVEEIAALERTLLARGVEAKRLKISVAAHSPMLDPFLDEFARRVAGIRHRAPSIPFVSNVDGSWAGSKAALEPGHWVRHLRGCVRFGDGLRELAKDAGKVFLEVGPGTTLGSLARQNLPATATRVVLQSLRHPQEDVSDLAVVYSALGRAWAAGCSPDWEAFHSGERRRRVRLPTYPFEHERHWIEPGDVAYGTRPAAAALERLERIDDWLTRRTWAQAEPKPPRDEPATRWLLFTDDGGPGGAAAESLRARGHDVTTVHPGASFARAGEHDFTLDPVDPAGYATLLRELAAAGQEPGRIAHFWLAAPMQDASNSADGLRRAEDRGFFPLLHLAQALASEDVRPPSRIDVVTTGLFRTRGEPVERPEAALVLGPAKVIPRELPGIACSVIDLETGDAAGCVEALLAAENEPEVAVRGGERWLPVLESVPRAGAEPQPPVRRGGVYIITGGLGGIGSAVARWLARDWSAKLVLVGRRAVTEGKGFARELEACGGEVLLAGADVCDEAAMRRAIAHARKKLGAIHGVFHAAGAVDDGVIQVKDRESVSRVLAPKTRGTIALDRALEGIDLDFLVLFSSTSALLGLPGQVDYTAANAFLDAFARHRSAKGKRTIAVQWGVWSEVGIAARMAGTALEPAASADAGPDRHPLLGRVASRGPGAVAFRAEYAPRDLWILDEHRLGDGRALIPGTAYLEMARAAMAEVARADAVEIEDLVFLAPLQVVETEPRAVRITLREDARGWSFEVASAQPAQASDPGSWTEHARALVRPWNGGSLGRLDSRSTASRCLGATIEGNARGGATRQERHLRFGRRWKNLEESQLGSGEALARLQLAKPFAGDLKTYAAHPALLDLATACGLPLIEGYDGRDDLYVPFSYKRVRIGGRLTPRILSHARLAGRATAASESASFDVTVASESGEVLVDVEELTLRRIAGGVLEAAPAKSGGPQRGGSGEGALLREWVKLGIRPGEGTRALEWIIASFPGSEVSVSPVRLDALLAQVDGETRRRATSGGAAGPQRKAGSAAPADEVEKAVAGMFEELLGARDVGAEDDFFDLGGHSLIAIRLVARIEKAFGKKLRLASLFEARTVRALADLVRGERRGSSFASLVAIQPKGDRAPFFCVHGVGGEVLSYAELARLLSPEQPFFGFRAQGHDGAAAPLESIEEQAELYVKEMRAVQAEGPYYVGGYSHGGRVAFEMACRLVEAGEEVAFLGVIDTWPGEGWPRGPEYAWRWLKNLPRWIVQDVLRSGARENWNRVARGARSVAKKVSGLLGRGKAREVDVADEMDVSGLPDSIRRTYQANFEAFVKYAPRPYAGRVVVFRAWAQGLFTPHEPDMGWGRWAKGGVKVVEVPGNHSSLLVQPHVASLARELKRELAAAAAAQESGARDGAKRKLAGVGAV